MTAQTINSANREFWAGVLYNNAGRPTAPPPVPVKVRKPGAGWWRNASPTTKEKSQ